METPRRSSTNDNQAHQLPPDNHQRIESLPPAKLELGDAAPGPSQSIQQGGRLGLVTSIKLLSCAVGFFLAGLSDGSNGALLPYMIRYFAVGTGAVTGIYATAFVAWLLVAVIGSYIGSKIGIGGALVFGAINQLLAQLLRIWTSTFGVFLLSFFFSALSLAFQDSQANTFVGTVKSAHRWLGLIHACYGFGCMIGPLVATATASARPNHWQDFYYFLMGIAILNLVLVTWSFRKEVMIGKQSNGRGIDDAVKEMKAIVKQSTIWKLSFFYFFHLGVAITAGGWLVEYLVKVRKGQLASVGYVATGFNGGLALGRLILVEPTHRIGEKPMLLIYSLLCLVLQVVFWQVKNVIADAVVVSVMGFLLGPFFAAGISVATRLLPKEIHPPALSLIFVVGQAGGTIFPVLTGIIAGKAGVEVLQPILVALIVAMGISWSLVPSVHRRSE